MPLQADDLVADYSISDLHCIMALAHENNRSRLTIWAGDKVTSALSSDELYKFLPVMMEMIVWKSSDENIDHLVRNTRRAFHIHHADVNKTCLYFQ